MAVRVYDDEGCALCGSTEHLRFACPQRKLHIVSSCALIGARHRLLCALIPIPTSVKAQVAAAVPSSSSAKVASRSLPDDPLFRPRPHRPGKRTGKKARLAMEAATAAQGSGGSEGAATVAVPDVPLSLEGYRTSLPPELADLMTRTWGEGSQRLESFCRCLSVPSAYICVRVNTLACRVDEAHRQLDAALEPMRQAYRSACPADDVGGPAAESLWKVSPHPLLPDVLTVASAPSAAPGSGTAHFPPQAATAAQGSLGERYARPPGDPYVVVVGRLCGEAVLRGADIFCKGVLAASSGLHSGAAVQLWADLDSLVLRGSDVTRYQGRRVLLGWGVARMTRAEMFREPRGVAVEVRRRAPPAQDAPSMNGLCEGVIRQQNLPSILVGHVLAPQAGETVLDMCAAPGGKTAHLAALMQSKGTLVAVDRSRSKVLDFARSLNTELGIPLTTPETEPQPVIRFLTPLAIDSSMLCPVAKEQETGGGTAGAAMSVAEVLNAAGPRADAPGLLHITSFPPASFDRVLLDGPCSALGQRPRLTIEFRGGANELTAIPRLQKRLANTAIALLKPGGTLAYSTCTVSPLENEAMVAAILDTHACMELCEAQPLGCGAPGLAGYGLSESQRLMVQRFDPGTVAEVAAGEHLGGDSIGFFVAKLRKKHSNT